MVTWAFIMSKLYVRILDVFWLPQSCQKRMLISVFYRKRILYGTVFIALLASPLMG